jgi:hypothetical protein
MRQARSSEPVPTTSAMDRRNRPPIALSSLASDVPISAAAAPLSQIHHINTKCHDFSLG